MGSHSGLFVYLAKTTGSLSASRFMPETSRERDG